MITDEMIEDARETYKAFVKACMMAGNASYSERDAWGAALAAAMPMIRAAALEEAARVAEYRDPGNPFAPRDDKGQRIAAAIRAMKGSDT